MKNLGFLALILAFSSHAETPKNPVQRYFETVPLSEAHVTLGNAPEGKLPQTSLDILVWNVKKGANKPFEEEFRKFGDEKEILLIQEAYTAPYFTGTIGEFAHYEWDLGLSFRYRMYNNEATGNMIGATVKPTWVKVEHTLDLEPVTKTPKSTVYAKFEVDGLETQVLVVSMHGINFNGFHAYIDHLEQVGKVIEAHDGPVILAGDFNTRTDEREAEMREFAKRHKLNEVSFKNSDIRMRSYGTKHFLDYAFLKGLKVNDAEVHASPGSDHQPMTLNLDFL